MKEIDRKIRNLKNELEDVLDSMDIKHITWSTFQGKFYYRAHSFDIREDKEYSSNSSVPYYESYLYFKYNKEYSSEIKEHSKRCRLPEILDDNMFEISPSSSKDKIKKILTKIKFLEKLIKLKNNQGEQNGIEA